jgi:hypothetical protein
VQKESVRGLRDATFKGSLEQGLDEKNKEAAIIGANGKDEKACQRELKKCCQASVLNMKPG